ncbi:MAG: sigma-70 family RNA polymerase sigma factor [Leptolyngbya sp.]|nr:sigma-70 family RNA polymerase sigma factor [Leptolyngbya sp.]
MASAANIPYFPESDHYLVQSLQHLSDRELVSLFQRHPEAGRYFTAIFCRYNPMVYTLIRHSARSPVQADYLFALTWRHILHELNGLDCPTAEATEDSQKPFTLQNWLVNVTALCINHAVIPEVESIHYSLAQASPPFWCYLEQALDQLPPLERLVLVLALTFRWSEARIVAYLRAEGEKITTADVRQTLDQAYQHLEEVLPEDIRIIYLNYQAPPTTEESEADPLGDDLLEGVFDWPEAMADALTPSIAAPTRRP